jgi:DNA mismatch repair protein MutH
MTSSEILICNEIAELLNKKYLIELIDGVQLNEKDKSNVAKLIKYYISKVAMYDEIVLNKYNIRIKLIPINSDYKCYESMSFPHMTLKDLVFEKWSTSNIWEEAQLRTTLRSIFLIIPIIKDRKKGIYNVVDQWQIGEICVWKANEQELISIGHEWELAKSIVEQGVKLTSEEFGKGFRIKNNLLKQSQTNYIHIRPHGINSFDIDRPYFEFTNQTIKITKQSFWLNQKFINNLLIKYRWIVNSREE